VATGALQFTLADGVGDSGAASFSPDGEILVASNSDTSVRVWSARTGKLERTLDNLALSTFTLAFSPDGQVLASGGADRVIYLWDTRTWKVLRTLTGQAEMVTSLVFSADGKTLLSGGSSEFSGTRPAQAHLWDVASGDRKRSVPSPHHVGSVAFAPDGKTIAVSDRDKEINIWEIPQPGH